VNRVIKRRIGRRGRELRVALYLALATYGVWNGLIFIAWLGFAFTAAELVHEQRLRAVIASVAFFVGGLILIGEVVASGPIDAGAALALVAGAALSATGGLFLVRIGRRRS
jgi:hypothetical protein